MPQAESLPADGVGSLMQIKLQPQFSAYARLFAAPQYAENPRIRSAFPQGMTRLPGPVPVF
jgi:hypothetical protein